MDCRENMILRILNAISITLSLALGIAAAVLNAVGLIDVEAVPLLVRIILISTAVISLVGVIALFFPCSLKCGYTQTAICRYFNGISLSIIGIFIIGLLILVLSLFSNAIATPILLGILVLLAAYLAGRLFLFAYTTLKKPCDRCSSQSEGSCCNCNR